MGNEEKVCEDLEIDVFGWVTNPTLCPERLLYQALYITFRMRKC